MTDLVTMIPAILFGFGCAAVGFVACAILTSGKIDDLESENARLVREANQRNLAEGLSQILGDQ